MEYCIKIIQNKKLQVKLVSKQNKKQQNKLIPPFSSCQLLVTSRLAEVDLRAVSLCVLGFCLT